VIKNKDQLPGDAYAQARGKGKYSVDTLKETPNMAWIPRKLSAAEGEAQRVLWPINPYFQGQNPGRKAVYFIRT
jgi:hypothetical protein